jgi:hypothetical protein
MTFAAEEPGRIMSQDAQGRVLVSRERRESLLEEYDRSGMSLYLSPARVQYADGTSRGCVNCKWSLAGSL